MILLQSFCIKFHLSNLGCIYFLIVHISEHDKSGTALDTWETKTEIPWYHRLSNLWLKGFLLLLGSWEWLLQRTRSNLEFSYNGLFNSPHKKTFSPTRFDMHTHARFSIFSSCRVSKALIGLYIHTGCLVQRLACSQAHALNRHA